MKLLSKAAHAAMTSYVDFIFGECLGEGETFTLGTAYREASTVFERAHVAAAIVYRAHALSDPPYRIIEERGPLADERLCAVADALGL